MSACPFAADTRTYDQIEQDVADRLRAEQQAAIVKGYVYSPEVWAEVTAKRLENAHVNPVMRNILNALVRA